MERLNYQIRDFIDERLNEELWNQEEIKEYDKEVEKKLNLARENFGNDSMEIKIMMNLDDIHNEQLCEMIYRAYRIGFKDGFKIINSMNTNQ